MPNAKQLLNQTEKKKHPSEVFYKNVFLKNFAMSMGKHLYEIFKNSCVQLLLNWLYEVIVWNFVFEKAKIPVAFKPKL